MRLIRFYHHRSGFQLLQLIGISCWFAVLSLFFLPSPFISFASQTGNYLSNKEIEKVRNSQKPHKRMAVFNDIFKRRMEGAIASKNSRAKYAAGNNKNTSKKKGREGVAQSHTAESLNSKAFTGWMEEVIMCLEEIETNLENYPLDQSLNVWDLQTGKPIRMNHKKFRKSLKTLLYSLLKFNNWLIKTRAHLNGFENKIAGETSEYVADVTENIKETIEMVGGKVSEKTVTKKTNKKNNT